MTYLDETETEVLLNYLWHRLLSQRSKFHTWTLAEEEGMANVLKTLKEILEPCS